VSINATLIFQLIVFAILVWFTMRFIWPPITAALDERAKKIAEGLSAADKAKADLAAANARTVVGTDGWIYFVDNVSVPPVAIFFCNSNNVTTAGDGSGGFLTANDL